MKKFEGIMICTDLDGTLLKNDKSISAENARAIEYFKDNEGLFTFVTGRMHFYSALRTTERTAAFIPSASPPLVSIPIVFIHSSSFYIILKLIQHHLWFFPKPLCHIYRPQICFSLRE